MTPPIQTGNSLKVSADPSPGKTSESELVAQCFVFKGVTFVGQDCFSQARVSIGSSGQADLVLDGPEIADLQAYVYLKEGQVIISDQTANGVRVNGTFQKTAMLRPLDLVDIGPYTLKIKAVRGDAAGGRKSRTPEGIKADAPKTEPDVSSRPHFPSGKPASGPKTPAVPEARGTQAGIVDTQSTEEAAAAQEDTDDAFADFFQFYADPATVNYDLVFYGQLRPTARPEIVKAGLQRLFRAGPQQIETLFRQPRVVIKKNLDYQKAQQLKTVFEKTGAQCHLEPVDDTALKVDDFEAQSKAPPVPVVEDPPSTPAFVPTSAVQKPDSAATRLQSTDRSPSSGSQLAADRQTAAKPQAAAESRLTDALALDEDVPALGPGLDEAERTPAGAMAGEPTLTLAEDPVPTETRTDTAIADELLFQAAEKAPESSEKDPFATVGIYDDEDEDDDDEADFQLKDKLEASTPPTQTGGEAQVQVIKLRNEQVIDIRYLKKRQRYTIDWAGRKIRLAENRRNAPALFYFSDQLTGRIESTGEGVVSTNRLMRDMKPWRKRKNIFRREMPTDGCVRIHDGDFEYRLSVCDLAPAADVKLPPKEKRHPYKHAATSFVFHIVFIAFLGLFPSFNADDSEPESHFVQLDQDQLAELEKIVKPQPKKPTPPPPPPKKVEPPPKPVVKKKAPVVKAKPNRVAGKKKTKGAKTASVSRHPNAGGGFGKGNVVNRDVNQAGLLSMLGDSVGFQPQAAVAAVTNLDAVTAPGGVGKSNFKVGGIVGKLGTDKISVPTGGIVATKGSKQVLRSIGASGPGKVAALEKGKIGHKQVAGTVTASLTKSVLIQGGGGMSRQAVKRVIDQHLDEITYCYETALISNPSIMGKMIFEWRILMGGEVGEVRIKSSTVNSHEIHACIKAAIKTWQFPKPKGSTVVVSYPFIFDVVGF